MWDDRKTTVLCVTAELMRYPSVYNGIVGAAKEAGHFVRIIERTSNVWCRDWMPQQVDEHYVKFGYNAMPPRLTDPPEDCWPTWIKAVKSDLNIDGGNIVRQGNRAVVTDMVFKDNKFSQRAILMKLEKDLEAEIIVIPYEPGDTLGHADGICKFVDDDTIIIEDRACMDDPVQTEYQYHLTSRLAEAGLDVVPLVFAYHKTPKMSEAEFRAKYPKADDYNPGYGYYVNFLRMKGLVIYPVFGIPEDEEMAQSMEMLFPKTLLRPVNCADLSMEGGLVNCVTANYYA
jgi:agmatine/peptidylarginine deiminase